MMMIMIKMIIIPLMMMMVKAPTVPPMASNLFLDRPVQDTPRGGCLCSSFNQVDQDEWWWGSRIYFLQVQDIQRGGCLCPSFVKNIAANSFWKCTFNLGKLAVTKTDEFSEKFQMAFSEKHIADFWGHIEVCTFWYNFTIKYVLNIKGNLQYNFLETHWLCQSNISSIL